MNLRCFLFAALMAAAPLGWAQQDGEDVAVIPIPKPLPAVVPDPPELDGAIAQFVAAITAESGPQTLGWTSGLGAPMSVKKALPEDWRWRGGASIVSSLPGLGGLSGLEVERHSNGALSILAVSDSGYWLGGTLKRLGFGHYDALSLSPPLRIKTRSGARPRQGQNNAEALALDDSGNVLVAFEGDHRVQRHPSPTSTPQVLSVPTALRSAYRNGGVEALAALPDGRYFAVGEGLNRQGGLRAWVFHNRSGNWPTMVYRKDVEDGHPWNPTAAAVMGNRLLLVERWWDRAISFRTRLVALPLDAIQPGARLEPEVLFELTPLVGVFGNIEGLAVTESPNGYTAVFVTDNQEFALLPTLVFALEWVE